MLLECLLLQLVYIVGVAAAVVSVCITAVVVLLLLF